MFRTGLGKPQITPAGTKDQVVLLWLPGAVAPLICHIRPSPISAQCKRPYKQPATAFTAETENLSDNRKERKIVRTLMMIH